MNLEHDDARGRIERERVVRMATVDEHGRAHVVPVIFVIEGDVFYSPTDKGKRPPKRLRNLERDARVTVLADFYDEDWLGTWWVRLRGECRVVGESPERTRALSLIDEKYPQFDGPKYLSDGGPVLAVEVKDWTGWAFSDLPAGTVGRPRHRWPWRRAR